ncbi:MAG: hypothetical protein HY709_05635, partial [Candidatus Latescibacteria bacterium]|nr:hypothetical protein [Candidatus Latescibacterota bacterium]
MESIMIFICREKNDLYRLLTKTGLVYPQYMTLAEAIDEAPEGAAVLDLADDYPRPGSGVDGNLLGIAASKGLRLYIEYPASLPGMEFGEPRPTHWERTVVSSDFFSPDLERDSILALHGCWFLPVKDRKGRLSGSRGVRKPGKETVVREPEGVELPHLVVGRVAGYRRAVYGLPGEVFPILFKLAGCDVLVATSKLSQFVTGRYGPSSAWKSLWKRLLQWLTMAVNEPSNAKKTQGQRDDERDRKATAGTSTVRLCGADDLPELAWTPTVGIQAGRDAVLPGTAEDDAFHRSITWFREHGVFSIDWKKGAIEGFESVIDHEGRQMRRTWARGDCTGETGMVFAYDWAICRNPASRHIGGQILDYVWSSPDFFQDDPESPVYGLNNWYERGPVFYGDDNARVILPTLAAGRLLDDDRWDERVLRCLLANLRTTGPLGFRKARLDYPSSFPDGRGWRYYRNKDVIHYAPHYQAYLWASFLWAYALTGHNDFLDRTKNALRMTMNAYPNWRWTNGLTQEMARMLLP